MNYIILQGAHIFSFFKTEKNGYHEYDINWKIKPAPHYEYHQCGYSGIPLDACEEGKKRDAVLLPVLFELEDFAECES